MNELTREQAITAMSLGQTVRHRFFSDNEWVRFNGIQFEFEDGVTCNSTEMWYKRTGGNWETGWSLVDTPTESKEVSGEGFSSMQEFPEQVKGEHFSKTVLIFDENDNEFFDLGYYDFEEKIWVVFGDMSFKMICWMYPPMPTEFLKTKNFTSEKHKGYC